MLAPSTRRSAFTRVGAALITARTDKQDAFGAIATVIPWERFCKTVVEAEALARPEEFDAFEKLGEHYSAIRRWSPGFLSAFEFESVPASASLLRAIEVLREMNRTNSATLPKSVPTGFVRQRWAAYVMPGGAVDRRHDELCVLSELRDRLLAGEVWVSGSRQYRSAEERLSGPTAHHFTCLRRGKLRDVTLQVRTAERLPTSRERAGSGVLEQDCGSARRETE